MSKNKHALGLSDDLDTYSEQGQQGHSVWRECYDSHTYIYIYMYI